ncbi:hypothetical protein Tco_1094560 [Tanacetum coccineum]|uniref:Uncharacterized protein n=1 Tax=Tanacetum coccineum TaxID=301880 RepID=A0ABQ5IHW5_9ASTR
MSDMVYVRCPENRHSGGGDDTGKGGDTGSGGDGICSSGDYSGVNRDGGMVGMARNLSTSSSERNGTGT